MTGHTRIEEMIAAYAINSFDADERREVEPELLGHFAGCRSCSELYTSVRETSADLAIAAQPVPLPEGIEDRLMAAVRGTPQIQVVNPQQARRPLRVRIVGATAAAMVAMFGFWNLQLAGEVRDLKRSSETSSVAMQLLNDPRTTKTVLAQRQGPGTITIALHPDGQAVLIGTKLPNLPPDRVLEVWLVRGGAPVAATIFRPENGTAVVTLDIDPRKDEALAITIEKGKVDKPTQKPIFQGVLSA